MSANNETSGTAATMSLPAQGGDEIPSYRDIASVKNDTASFHFQWADEPWNPNDFILVVPKSNPNVIAALELDASWGSFKDMYTRHIAYWGLKTEATIKVGGLTQTLFTPSEVKFTDVQTGTAHYISGYLSAANPTWDSSMLGLSEKPAAFRNGFADGMSVALRKAALQTEAASPAELDLLLRKAQTGENSELKSRLEKIMAAPQHAIHIVRFVEACMSALAKSARRDEVEKALSVFSSNRRAIIMRKLPVQTRQKTDEIKEGKKKKTVTINYKVSVTPTLSRSYQGLMTDAEAATATRWNSFAKVDTWPIDDRAHWKDELKHAEMCVNVLTGTVAKMRRVMRQRKQAAYASLPDDKKKDGKALADAIKAIVNAVGEDQLALLIIANLGSTHLDRKQFWASLMTINSTAPAVFDSGDDTDVEEEPQRDTKI